MWGLERVLGTLAALVVLVAVSSVRGEPISPAELFGNVEFEEMELSPDGQTLAITGPLNGGINLAVLDLGTRQPFWLTRHRGKEVHDIRWVGERLVFRIREDGYDTGALFSIGRDGKNGRTLVHSFQYQAREDMHVRSLDKVHFLAQLDNPEEPEILVETTEVARAGRHQNPLAREVFRLNVQTGGKTAAASHPRVVTAWIPDLKGQLRAVTTLEGSTHRLEYRDTLETPWRTLAEWGLLGNALIPLAFAADNRTLVVWAAPGTGTHGVYLFDVDKGAVKQKVWQHETVDVDISITDPYLHAMVGLRYDDGRTRQVYFDASLKAIQAAVDKALPDTVNELMNWSRNRRRFVFLSTSDREPGLYHLFDLDGNKLERLGAKARWLTPDRLSPMKSVRYEARDGLSIPAYLTVPKDRGTGPQPLVLIVHGGPWERNRWGFDPEVQFFASRGYAVLQPDFRGSVGYGDRHFRLGWKEWGQKMQDDLTDGVGWAIKEGIADPARVVIYGASYGGYAVMCGLTRTPELYRCGINYVGVTDVGRLIRSITAFYPKGYGETTSDLVGDLEKETARLEAISPIRNVGAIRAPVLLAYGERDPVVDIAHGRKLAQELRRAGKEYELIVEADEGHGFHNPTNRVRLFERIDAFLAKSMKP